MATPPSANQKEEEVSPLTSTATESVVVTAKDKDSAEAKKAEYEKYRHTDFTKPMLLVTDEKVPSPSLTRYNKLTSMPWVQLGYQALLSSRVNVAVTDAQYLDLGLAEMLDTHAGILYYYNPLVHPKRS